MAAMLRRTVIMLALAGCAGQTPSGHQEDAVTREARTAAEGAYVELEGGEPVLLPGTAPLEAERALAAAGDGLSDPRRIAQPTYRARPGWFLIDTAMVYPATTSPSEARRATLLVARAAGLVMALPATVSMTSLLSDVMDETAGVAYEKSTWSTFALSSVAGHLVDEKILTDRMEPMAGSAFRYRIAMEARVVPVKGSRDPSLRLEVELNDRLLEDGDELIIKARATRDGYLYVFNFLSDQSVTLLYPNGQMQQSQITAGQWTELPSRAERARGIRYRVAANPDLPTTTETIFCLFSRQPIADLGSLITVGTDYVSFSAGDKSFTRFQRWLSEIPLGQRVERAVQLHIVSRKEPR
ncbi:MAG: DUF4384 domain-containing protein [Candidatus Marinimicrobia bacterium]|nr:DUF4384 domain-containing protein [Candidatus Neomarinimicrobiota bacterium]